MVQEVSNLRLGLGEMESVLETPRYNMTKALAAKSNENDDKENVGEKDEVVKQLISVNKKFKQP